jgi:hypothetical protein
VEGVIFGLVSPILTSAAGYIAVADYLSLQPSSCVVVLRSPLLAQFVFTHQGYA